jgi:site-specific recombinase XerD
MQAVDMTEGDVRMLRSSFELALRASNRSPRTVQSYLEALDQFTAYLVEQGMPTVARSITREHVEAWLVSLQAAGRTPATVRVRHASLRQFFNFLVEEGKIPDTPMRNVRAPAVPEQPVDVLAEDDIRALLATCKSRRFEDMRDAAIIRVLIDTGIRRGELVGLTLEDVDLGLGVLFVMGEGRRGRAVPIGTKTARELDRYVRTRAKHRHAPLPHLWITMHGAMSEATLSQLLEARAERAGIGDVHPHMFRLVRA